MTPARWSASLIILRANGSSSAMIARTGGSAGSGSCPSDWVPPSTPGTLADRARGTAARGSPGLTAGDLSHPVRRSSSPLLDSPARHPRDGREIPPPKVEVSPARARRHRKAVHRDQPALSERADAPPDRSAPGPADGRDLEEPPRRPDGEA